MNGHGWLILTVMNWKTKLVPSSCITIWLTPICSMSKLAFLFFLLKFLENVYSCCIEYYYFIHHKTVKSDSPFLFSLLIWLDTIPSLLLFTSEKDMHKLRSCETCNDKFKLFFKDVATKDLLIQNFTVEQGHIIYMQQITSRCSWDCKILPDATNWEVTTSLSFEENGRHIIMCFGYR